MRIPATRTLWRFLTSAPTNFKRCWLNRRIPASRTFAEKLNTPHTPTTQIVPRVKMGKMLLFFQGEAALARVRNGQRMIGVARFESGENAYVFHDRQAVRRPQRRYPAECAEELDAGAPGRRGDSLRR